MDIYIELTEKEICEAITNYINLQVLGSKASEIESKHVLLTIRSGPDDDWFHPTYIRASIERDEV